MNELQRSKIAALCSVTFIFLTALATGAAAQFTPIRPPAVPLITRSPYVSTWMTSDTAAGALPTFWNGNVKDLVGIASIDGRAYLFFGYPGMSVPQTMSQTSLQTTPTQSVYTFSGGGVTLMVNFLSPVEANDVQRLSIPLSYITAQAQSSDGNPHTVSVYFDITGEWAYNDSNAQIVWAPETILRGADGSGTPGSLMTWEVTPQTPHVLSEGNDYPQWGTALLATAVQPGLTYQSGGSVAVRSQFVSSGSLANTNDTNQPRPINNNWPVFAYDLNLGTVNANPSSPFTLLLGHVRDPAVSYQGQPVPPLWKSYFNTYQNMLAFSLNDASGAQTRANLLDQQITQAATQIGGTHYAALCALSLRQAFAGTELVDPTRISPALSPALPDSDPWLFMKEISSSGNVSTVDVVYPSFPVFLYTNPELVRLLIDPLIYYPESGKWPLVFAEHDIGASYPNADGHNDGGGENMPVEESANLLIMADAYMRFTPLPGRATGYAQQHYAIFKQWADYLISVPSGVSSPNALDPQFQNQTDDFTGQIAHSVNLSLKGIIAVGAMGQIAAYAGNSADAAYYTSQAQTLIGHWTTLSQNAESSHLLLQYQEAANAYSADTTSEPDTAWSLKYNAFPDTLLETYLIPPSVLNEEASFYQTKEETYGIPLDYRNPYAKADWEMWTAGSTDNPMLRQDIFDEVYAFANTSPSRVPFTDWYYPDTGSQTGFEARPVVGGVFAPMFRAVAAPTFSPSGGPYLTAQTVTLSDTTPGAAIYYTTDGSTPTRGSAAYASPVTLSSSAVLQAFATRSGFQDSRVNRANYLIYTAPPLTNGSFEAPSVGSANYRYAPVSPGWTFTGASGIQSNGSAWNAPAAPDGTQTAFLQGLSGSRRLGALAQSVTFSSAGTYTLNFQAARLNGQVQPLRFSVDGVPVGSLLTPAGSVFTPLATSAFTINTAGSHQLTLAATNGSQRGALIDTVFLTATLVPPAPVSVSATAGIGQVTLNWAASSRATSYMVYRGVGAGGEAAAPIATGITGTTFSLTSAAGVTSFYTIAAVNSSGSSGPSSEVSATPLLPPAGVLLPTSEQTGYWWKYTLNAPAGGWFAATYNDSAWASGLAGFGSIGFGGAVSRTPWTATPGDIWIRRHFPITNSVPANAQIRVFYDEGCEIYLNGILAASTTGYVTSYVSLPISSQGLAALKVGDNVVAIHCTQTTGGQYIDAGILYAAAAQAAPPTISPDGGAYTTAQYATLSDATPDAVIHYTIDGSLPSADSPVYSRPLILKASTRVQAIAVQSGISNSSVTSATFTISAAH